MSIRVDNATSTIVTAGASQSVAGERPTRRQITIRNNGTTTDTIHVNFDAAATTSHFLVGAGVTVVFICQKACYVVAGTGVPTVSVMDEYD